MSKTLLKIENLFTGFRNGAQITHAVKDASLTINKGETLALVGESGSGKSVLALSILQLLPYPTAFHKKGSILFAGEQLMHAPEPVMSQIRGNRIAMIFQEPMTALNPLHRIKKQIGEILLWHKKCTATEVLPRIKELLKQVDLEDTDRMLNAFPHELSGGQRQRVMIAMALANDPELLIADEPTTALDVTIQADILKLLGKLQQDRKMAMLLITHDLNLVTRVSHRVSVMKDGEIVETGKTKTVFETPKHEYTKKLLGSFPTGTPQKITPNAPVIMEAENMRVWFPIKKGLLRRVTGHVKAVNDMSFNVKQGETLGVVGESGSGKTTLGLALLRLTASTGQIMFDHQLLHNLNNHDLRAKRADMQIVFQDPFASLSPRLTIRDIIEEGLKIHFPHMPALNRLDIIKSTLKEVGLEDEKMINRYPHEFSGGQRQRISIARALALKPKLIVLDEPTSALDMSVQTQIVDLLRTLQRTHNLSYIFISHDLRVVRAMSHKIIVMKNGKIVEQGTAETIFKKPQQAYTKSLIKAAFALKTA